MAEEQAEHEFLGRHKDKVWTYLILMFLFVALIVVVNVVWKDPAGAESGLKKVFGLPSWALATGVFLIGAIIFWLGLKVETDWPEAFGAFLISGAIAWFELIIGWNRFELGLVVVPYVIPLAVFVVLLMYGMKKSV